MSKQSKNSKNQPAPLDPFKVIEDAEARVSRGDGFKLDDFKDAVNEAAESREMTEADLDALGAALRIPSYTQDVLAEAYLEGARKRLHDDMIASRQAASRLAHGKEPLDEAARQTFQDDVEKRCKERRAEILGLAESTAFVNPRPPLGGKRVQDAAKHYLALHGKDHPMDPLLMPQGGFKRGELVMIGSTKVPVPRLGNLVGRNAPVDSFASIMRNMAKSLTHAGYRMKLSTAYRILHPKKDKEGRLIPVRASGESEARMIARMPRDAGMARALRVVSRHEEIQRLRREQNKKQFKKVKRHRKSWQ